MIVEIGGAAVLNRVSFDVRAGEAVALIGSNGAGKSTLLAACGGLIKAASGRIELMGRDVWHTAVRDPRWLRRRVGMALQFPERGFFASTVRGELLFTARRVGKKEASESALRSLQRLGLPAEWLDRSPFALSGGEKRRLALAAAIAHEPELLLFDEPEAGLDARGRRLVGALLRDHAAGGGAALVATHDVEGATGWADRILLLEEGRIRGEARAAQWERGEWPDWLLPFLADGGRAAEVHRAAKAHGVSLPAPYGRPLRFLEALERLGERGERGGKSRGSAGRP